MREPIVCKGLVEEGHRAGVGDGDANHHANAGGFARAVGAEEAEHAARFNLETEVCYGDLGVVNFADVLQLYDGHGFSGREVKVSLAGEIGPTGMAAKPTAGNQGTVKPLFLHEPGTS
jgi:hypothetical protein